jgi:hypothetical protein
VAFLEYTEKAWIAANHWLLTDCFQHSAHGTSSAWYSEDAFAAEPQHLID